MLPTRKQGTKSIINLKVKFQHVVYAFYLIHCILEKNSLVNAVFFNLFHVSETLEHLAEPKRSKWQYSIDGEPSKELTELGLTNTVLMNFGCYQFNNLKIQYTANLCVNIMWPLI